MLVLKGRPAGPAHQSPGRPGAGRSRRPRLTAGLILLVFIAALVAFGWTRLRRRAGMSVTGRHWVTVMAVVILGVLALWAYSTHR